MNTKRASAATAAPKLQKTGAHRRRWLPYLSIVALALLLIGVWSLLGELSLPETSLRLALAKEPEAAPAKPASPPAEEPLLTLSTNDIPLLQSLQERQTLLDQRQKQLDQREAALQQLHKSIEEKLALLTVLRKEIGALIEEKEAFEEQRFEHLVKVYEGMKPAEAASLIERLQGDTAVKLFYRMKEKKVSQILGFISPDVAAKLSEQLAAYQNQIKQNPTVKEQ
jgi:flagellar motility protein MotE (MotC chaperone)